MPLSRCALLALSALLSAPTLIGQQAVGYSYGAQQHPYHHDSSRWEAQGVLPTTATTVTGAFGDGNANVYVYAATCSTKGTGADTITLTDKSTSYGGGPYFFMNATPIAANTVYVIPFGVGPNDGPTATGGLVWFSSNGNVNCSVRGSF